MSYKHVLIRRHFAAWERCKQKIKVLKPFSNEMAADQFFFWMVKISRRFLEKGAYLFWATLRNGVVVFWLFFDWFIKKQFIKIFFGCILVVKLPQSKNNLKMSISQTQSKNNYKQLQIIPKIAKIKLPNPHSKPKSVNQERSYQRFSESP
jgi:hypothetical protein